MIWCKEATAFITTSRRIRSNHRLASTVERNFGDSPAERLRDRQELLQSDENNLFQHQSKLGEFCEKYTPFYEKFLAKEIHEDNFLYTLHKTNYKDCKLCITQTKNEIAELQKSIMNSYKTQQKKALSAYAAQSTAGEENDDLSESSESGYEPVDPFANVDNFTGDV